MAAKIIRAADIIPVTAPPTLFYGTPGAGKTSIGFTGLNPVCLDFDGGAHRSAFRKDTIRIESWADMNDGPVKAELQSHDTVIIDTVGTCLDFMASALTGKGMRTPGGQLSLQGYGALKGMFSQWLGGLRISGKQIVMVAHEKAGKDDEPLRPDITGGSYSIVMQSADIVGYVSYRNGHRHVSFDPCDSFFAKNGAHLPPTDVPDFARAPSFLADLLTEAKKNLGRASEASAVAVAEVAKWQAWTESCDTLDMLNAGLKKIAAKKYAEPIKSQVWHVLTKHAEANEWAFDKKIKAFVAAAKEVA